MKSKSWIPAVLLVLVLIGFSRLSPNFLDVKYLLSNSTLYMETGLLAIGMTFIIISGNIDLSVGSNMVLTACLTAKLLEAGCPIIAAIPFACLTGAILGALNGWLISAFKLPSFLVTLGTMAFYRGIAQAMMGPSSIKLPAAFKGIDRITFGFIPVPVWAFLVLGLVGGIILHRTVFGRWVVALGTSEPGATYSGIPIERVKILVFAVTGLLAGIGSLLLDSRLAVARHDLAKGVELDAITVVVLGGASILGGRGSMLGTMLALLLIDFLKTGMGVMNIKSEYQLTVIGALLIIAALSMNLAERIDVRLKKKSNSPVSPVQQTP